MLAASCRFALRRAVGERKPVALTPEEATRSRRAARWDSAAGVIAAQLNRERIQPLLETMLERFAAEKDEDDITAIANAEEQALLLLKSAHGRTMALIQRRVDRVSAPPVGVAALEKHAAKLDATLQRFPGIFIDTVRDRARAMDRRPGESHKGPDIAAWKHCAADEAIVAARTITDLALSFSGREWTPQLTQDVCNTLGNYLGAVAFVHGLEHSAKWTDVAKAWRLLVSRCWVGLSLNS